MDQFEMGSQQMGKHEKKGDRTGKCKMRKRKKKNGNVLCKLAVLLLAMLVCAPAALAVLGSFKSGNELKESLAPVLSSGDSDGKIYWSLFPLYPTFRAYVELLFWTPEFFTVFWNSVKIVLLILLGQLFVSVPAAWSFATFRWRGSKILFTVYVILMLLPFQVTMLPSFLVMDRLGLLNTHSSIILPAVFSTFSVFLVYRGFTAIPKEFIEAARVDGAGELLIFLKIGIPLGSPGILSAAVLGFLDYWNMMEQPLAFLKEKTLWPLSLYLPEIDLSQAGIALAASVVMLIPAVFVFVIGQDYLEQGIVASGIKK